MSFPESFIEQVKEKTDIVELISHYGVPLKKAGKEWTACCPFHEENSPSFKVSRDKGFFKCFGCHQGGDSIQFLKLHQNLEFVDAIKALAALAGLPLPENRDASYSDANTRHKRQLFDALKAAAEYYAYCLSKNEGAKAYLHNRQFDPLTIDTFQLGFSPAGGENLFHFLSKKFPVSILEDAGLVKESEFTKSGYKDFFHGRIMFPIRNHKGGVIAFGARNLLEVQPKTRHKIPKYLNSPDSEVFSKSNELYGLHEAKKHTPAMDHLICVEGYTDVSKLHQFGVTNVVAALGTAFTPIHADKLLKSTSKLYFVFDGDNAGYRAAWRALEILLPKLKSGILVNFAFLDHEDPDTFIQKHGADHFRGWLSSDSWSVSSFMFHHFEKTIGVCSPEQKAAFLEQVATLILTIEDRLLQDLFVDDAINRLRLPNSFAGRLKNAVFQTESPASEAAKYYNELS